MRCTTSMSALGQKQTWRFETAKCHKRTRALQQLMPGSGPLFSQKRTLLGATGMSGIAVSADAADARPGEGCAGLS
jgi:hypothetical protein